VLEQVTLYGRKVLGSNFALCKLRHLSRMLAVRVPDTVETGFHYDEGLPFIKRPDRCKEQRQQSVKLILATESFRH